MNLTNEYYYFTEALDKETCDKIMKAGVGDFAEAVVGHGGEKIVDKEIRTSKTAWSNDQWLYDLIWPYMEEANVQAGWEYDIKTAEAVQITRYETGGFYNFHKDGKSDNLGAYNEPQNLFTHGNVRKLSMAIILNDDYEGAGFEFASMGNGASTIYTPEFNKIGSIIVFPSFLVHRVKPVTKGTRYAAVCWFLGPPFK
jgi:PKHD-type hydroxylase